MSTHSKKEGQTPIETEKKSFSMDFLEKSRAQQIRMEIGLVADRSYRNGLINSEAYQGYRDLENKNEAYDITADMLKTCRDFAKEHETRAIRIYDKLQSAIQGGFASEADRDFLMKTLVADNLDFSQRSGEIESLINEKIKRMQKDSEKYQKLSHHPLFNDRREVNLPNGEKIKLIDQKAFLKMTVPQRREFLKSMEEALKNTEKLEESGQETMNKKLNSDYQIKLDSAVKEGTIGSHSYNAFMEEFKTLNIKDKKHWHNEFENQIKRYSVLWKQIRTSLRGEALKSMEKSIDSSGYTELFTQFGEIKRAESERLKNNYSKALEVYRKNGIIGKHSIEKFERWMDKQKLEDQYDAEAQLPNQMHRYKELWDKIGRLNKKQSTFLISKIDDWGYSAIEKQYQIFSSKGAIDSQDESNAESILKQVRSDSTRKAMINSAKILEKQGNTRKKSFVGMLGRMFSSVSQKSFDASSFEDNLRKSPANDNGDAETQTDKIEYKTKSIKEGAEGEGDIFEKEKTHSRDLGKEKNSYETTRQVEEMEANGLKTKTETGFIQVEDRDGKRNTQISINQENGIETFLSEESRHAYRSSENRGKDNLSLAIEEGGSGRTVELDLKEIRTFEKYLKSTANEDREAA